jgi:hypothetical protein
LPETADARILELNLARLAAAHPALAVRIRSARPDPRFIRLEARSGAHVPAVRSPAGDAPLHSLYDPRQESRRLVQTAGGNGFLVFCGLGGGFHVEAALEDPRTLGVLVIEKDESVLRGLLGQIRFDRLLQDPRVTIAVGLGEIRPGVLFSWKPAVMGGMKLVPLRSWCGQEKEFFDAAASEIETCIEMVRADYGVQSHFGKRWFSNILRNLPRVTGEPKPPLAGAADGQSLAVAAGMSPAVAAVTAAGPSLERYLASLSLRRRELMIVAADTSLPALLRSGVQPDAVLSIDCQVYGYHHFLQGLPASTSLYLDLASPPALARRFPSAHFVASGHPFARYLGSRWIRLPAIDTSGGNVAHAAVSLARALGAQRIEVYGADFAYPSGKPYARGTYLYDFFQASQDRCSPADSALVSFALNNAALTRDEGRPVYSTPLLRAYRERFREMMAAMDVEVVPAPGDGLRLEPAGQDRGGQPAGRPTNRAPEWPAPPRHPLGWKELLSDFADRLRSLPAPALIAGMDELWEMMLPAAARAVKDGFAPGAGALEEARRWSLEQIGNALRFSEK